MVITPNGASGLNAMLLVEEVLKHEQGIAPSLSMVERTAVTWGQLARLKNVTQMPVVSFYPFLS